jgi:hypothetical protein
MQRPCRPRYGGVFSGCVIASIRLLNRRAVFLRCVQALKKTTQLKNLIQGRGKNMSFIMEAHNGLSAKIVEEAGFKGIWGSGLSISAGMGVRDSNEASYTQVLDTLEFMSDATEIPILLDGDTGYGNYNNARRLVRKLEQRGIAGVCLEDKLFPKTNSLLAGTRPPHPPTHPPPSLPSLRLSLPVCKCCANRDSTQLNRLWLVGGVGAGAAQPLADIEEFSLKIRACKDTQRDADFQVLPGPALPFTSQLNSTHSHCCAVLWCAGGGSRRGVHRRLGSGRSAQTR